MIHLPPASWWRFIGWLVLGMSIYFAFGYNHSAVGRSSGRPETPTGMQRVVAFGFLLAGVGLFVIQHDAGPGELFALALDSNARAAIGLTMIALGLIATLLGGFRMGVAPPRRG
jgi:APA family basic amino acid/polyamine antiporter